MGSEMKSHSILFDDMVRDLELYRNENDAGEFVDLYCPRKCTSSHRIIYAKNHDSVQLNITDVYPETGRMTGT
uniref:40S ribosomal protein S21 n=1 Tax=Megaselia scalaris TaxID=36166 RepID=T1GFX2_MEGSC